SAAEVEEFIRRGIVVFDRLSSLAVPTVAVVHGACLGGGLELALACRRRVALASAAPLQIGTPDIHLGLMPGWDCHDRLPRLMGPDAGLEFLISGRSIGYLRARSHSIVNRLAADADLMDAVVASSRSNDSERTWPSDAWDAAWARAHAQVDEQPAEHPEA